MQSKSWHKQHFPLYLDDLVEKNQKEVTIHDLDPLALTLLVDFSYTGEIVISEDNVQVRIFIYIFTYILLQSSKMVVLYDWRIIFIFSFHSSLNGVVIPDQVAVFFSVPKSAICEVLLTVSAQIERHSWLEDQWTHFGRTIVIFGERLSKDYSVFEQNLPKVTIVHRQKTFKF